MEASVPPVDQSTRRTRAVAFDSHRVAEEPLKRTVTRWAQVHLTSLRPSRSAIVAVVRAQSISRAPGGREVSVRMKVRVERIENERTEATITRVADVAFAYLGVIAGPNRPPPD